MSVNQLNRRLIEAMAQQSAHMKPGMMKHLTELGPNFAADELFITGTILRPCAQDDYDSDKEYENRQNEWIFEAHFFAVGSDRVGNMSSSLHLNFGGAKSHDEVIEEFVSRILDGKESLGTRAIADIATERDRQREKWSAEHDDAHTSGELAMAARLLAHPPSASNDQVFYPEWAMDLWNRHTDNRRQQLVIAGALLTAEIDRLDRQPNAKTDLTEALSDITAEIDELDCQSEDPHPNANHADVWHWRRDPSEDVACNDQGPNEGATNIKKNVNCPTCQTTIAEHGNDHGQ